MRALTILFLFYSGMSFGQPVEIDSLINTAQSYVCRDLQKSDSLINLILEKSAASDYQKGLANAMKFRGTNMLCLGRMDSSVILLKLALRHFDQANDRAGYAKTLNNLSVAYKNRGQLDSALLSIRQMSRIANEIGDSRLEGYALSNLSSSYLEMEMQDSILYYAFEAIRVAQEVGDPKLEANMFLNIGTAYFNSTDYENAYHYYTEAREVQESMGDEVNLSVTYHNLGGIKSELGELDSGIYYVEKGLDLALKTGNSSRLPSVYQGLSHLYFKKKDYQKSILLGKEGETQSLIQNQTTFLPELYNTLASAYLKIGQPESALDYTNKAVAIAIQHSLTGDLSSAYKHQAEALQSLGKFDQSLDAFKKFYELDSSLRSDEKNKVIAEMETRYQTEKKDHEIASLTQEATLNQLELKQQRTISYGIGMVATLMIMIGFLYYRQEKIRKEKGYLAMEQKLLRTQMNPHFIFNSMGAIQHYLYQNDTQEAGKYMGMFSTLMRQILDHSRAEFIALKDEISTLTNYMELQKLRFEDKFSYEIEVDEELDETYSAVPPMFAQPFIENALEHGLFKSDRDNLIKVRFYAVSDQLIGLEIVDTGTGLTHKSTTDGHQSHATKITRERLATFRKSLQQKTELVIENIKDTTGQVSGLRVNLTLPTTIKLPS